MDEFAQNTKEVKQSALQGLWSSRTLGAASLFLSGSLELADAPLTFHVSNILRKHSHGPEGHISLCAQSTKHPQCSWSPHRVQCKELCCCFYRGC